MAAGLPVARLAAADGTDSAPPPAPPAEWAGEAPGQVIVLQGDLLLIRGHAVRLLDVAAPTPAQRCDTGHGFAACGATATQALRELIGTGAVQCRIAGLEATPWARPKPVWVGVCQARGADLGGAVVVAGYAVAAPGSAYANDTVTACLARRGIWAWSLESPWTFAARRDGQGVRPVFIGARSKTPCLRAIEAAKAALGELTGH